MKHSTTAQATVELEWTPYAFCEEEYTAEIVFDGDKLLDVLWMNERGTGHTYYGVTEREVWEECAEIVASRKKGLIWGYLVADNGEDYED